MWKKIVLVVVLAISLRRIFLFVSLVGLHKHVYDHRPGPCRTVSGIEEGAEDIEVTSGGLAFMSSGVHVDGGNPEIFLKRRGAIMVLDLNHLELAPHRLPMTGVADSRSFYPHGLGLWEDEATGTVYLYVVNHVPGDERVDKFRYSSSPPSLNFIRSFRGGSNFRSLNDIVLISEDQFYFTNFYHHNIFAELHLILHWGSVGFHDGTESRLVAGGLFCPDGVQISKEHTHLYVAEWCGQNMNVFEIQSDKNISLVQVMPVYSSLNNLAVDSGGDVWVAGDPVNYKAVEHRQQPHDVRAPAQVFHFKVEDGLLASFTEVFSEMESVASSSSAAVYYNQTLLVGSKGSGAVLCDVMWL